MQPTLEGPAISQRGPKASMPQAQLYAYINAKAMAITSNTVAGQTSLVIYDLYTLFNSGTTHSFISTKMAFSTNSGSDKIPRILRIALCSAKILMLEFFMRQNMITINGVILCVDLIAIEIRDFDVILGMDFLVKHNAIIDFCYRKVTFRPNDGKKFQDDDLSYAST